MIDLEQLWKRFKTYVNTDISFFSFSKKWHRNELFKQMVLRLEKFSDDYEALGEGLTSEVERLKDENNDLKLNKVWESTDPNEPKELYEKENKALKSYVAYLCERLIDANNDDDFQSYENFKERNKTWLN